MILLDTNVVSEPLRPLPNPKVIAWIDAQALETLYLSVMTAAELRAGVALMPAGRRRQKLHEYLEDYLLPSFAARVLPFDLLGTTAYVQVLARVRGSGASIATADACIAATALAYGFTVATRDTHPFQAAGLAVINPWEHAD